MQRPERGAPAFSTCTLFTVGKPLKGMEISVCYRDRWKIYNVTE